jgi:hypothetical protein
MMERKWMAASVAPRIFAADNDQDGTVELLEPFRIDFVEANPVNDYARAHGLRVAQVCMERFQSTHAESYASQLPAWPPQIIQSSLQNLAGCVSV